MDPPFWFKSFSEGSPTRSTPFGAGNRNQEDVQEKNVSTPKIEANVADVGIDKIAGTTKPFSYQRTEESTSKSSNDITQNFADVSKNIGPNADQAKSSFQSFSQGSPTFDGFRSTPFGAGNRNQEDVQETNL